MKEFMAICTTMGLALVAGFTLAEQFESQSIAIARADEHMWVDQWYATHWQEKPAVDEASRNCLRIEGAIKAEQSRTGDQAQVVLFCDMRLFVGPNSPLGPAFEVTVIRDPKNKTAKPSWEQQRWPGLPSPTTWPNAMQSASR